MRIYDDAHQSHVLKEVVSTRFSLRRNKESVVVVVVVLLKKTKDIFLSAYLSLFLSSFFSRHAKKQKNATDRRFFEFALFLRVIL